jgi:hypothetical protein
MQHEWPGNIRELKNCITRAMTFSEGSILLSEHIVLGQAAASPGKEKSSPQPAIQPQPEPPGNGKPHASEAPLPSGTPDKDPEAQSRKTRPPAVSAPAGLNPRQIKAWPAIFKSGGTNRAQYQEAVGEDISVRTAQYDLQDLVLRGLLKKAGKGPSSRYVLTSRL